MKTLMFVLLLGALLVGVSPSQAQLGEYNFNGVALGSAYRTDSVAFPSTAEDNLYSGLYLKNVGYAGIRLWVDVADTILTPSLVVNIQGYDPVSGTFQTLLSSAAITDDIRTYMLIYPGCIAVANKVLNEVAPMFWRITAIPADTDSAKYSIGYEYLK